MVRLAVRTTLCRLAWSWAVQLPCQTEMHPVRTLSTAEEYKVLRRGGETLNFLSLRRKYNRCLDDFVRCCVCGGSRLGPQ